MVFRKPYVFFIKMFKPIHIIMSIIIAFLIFLQVRILNFLNTYIHFDIISVDKTLVNDLIDNNIYIFPIIILFLSMIILGVMLRKNKPLKFYLVNIFAFIVVLVINFYTINFLKVFQDNVVSIVSAKLIHDLVLINIIIESISFVFTIIRGLGVNFKSFNFDNDISKFDINESDKEEYELSVDVDINEVKARRRKRLRNFKYLYLENKFLVISIFISILLISLVSTFFIINTKKNIKKEGSLYSIDSFNLMIDNTYILNEDYRGNKLTDNYLIIVNAKLRSNFYNKYLFLKDFSLKIGDVYFEPTKDYSDKIFDLGTVYDNNVLDTTLTNYLFVFEIKGKYLESEMYLNYISEGDTTLIKLNPQKIKSKNNQITSKIAEEITFENDIGDIKFKIDNYELKEKFQLNYKYCIKDNDCIDSIEYLKPSINTNFDKCILKLNMTFESSDTNFVNFYDLFNKFGVINYQKNGNTYYQSSGFEQINSKMVKLNSNYIGVDCNILNSDSIILNFNIRGSRYDYILK